MKTGLVIGKFMPVHEGHIALIRFAAAQCDELIVSMSYTKSDSIDHTLRFAWLSEIFAPDPHIKVEESEDNFDNDALVIKERVRLWSAFIKKRFPKVDVLFSSEEYGDPFADELGIPHVLFDQPRVGIRVSGTLIRNHPFMYWDYIPESVRPYFVKKICFYGPESTGKTSIAKKFATRYHTNFVPEVAREMLTTNKFSADEIIKIGEGQTNRIFEKLKTANKLLFCDTDLITTQIYSRHYLGEVPGVLFDLEKKISYDQYFLMDIDVPWIADGLRDLGDKREEMFSIFKKELELRNIEPCLVRGTPAEREKIIDAKLAAFF